MRFLILGAFIVSPSAGSAQQSKDEQDLIALEKELCGMLITPNPARQAEVFAADYIGFGSRGTVTTGNKPDPTPARPSGNKTTSCVDEDVKVRVYGDAAVVTATGIRAGVYHGAQYTNRRVRYSDTFVRRNGKWVAVASHTSLLTSPPKQVDWLAMERGMLQAVQDKNLSAFSAGVDSTFTGVYPTGVMNREQQIKVVQSEVLKDFTVQDFTAKAIDDQTELVTYLVTTTTAEGNGTYAISSLWRWNGTAWRTILHTASPVATGATRAGARSLHD